MNRQWLKRVLVTNRTLTPHRSLADIVANSVGPSAITMIIVREPDLLASEQIALVREIKRRTGLPVLLARRPELVRECGADGVQIGYASPPPSVARAELGEGFVIGVSVHSVAEGITRATQSADYLLLGPLYSTPKKHGPEIPLGLDAMRELSRAVPETPVVGIGGIDLARENDVLAAGAAGIAAIRGFLHLPEAGRRPDGR